MSRSGPRGRIVSTAADNMMRWAELGVAAQQVVGARVAMGLQAAQAPRIDHLHEAARMTGEKFTAFGEAAAATAPSAARMGARLATAGFAEANAAMSAAISLAQARHPAAAAGVSTRYAMDAATRFGRTWTAMAGAALGAQAAALRPLHRTATGNARRLKGR